MAMEGALQGWRWFRWVEDGCGEAALVFGREIYGLGLFNAAFGA